ncbi:5-deoxy-glucuronate isomerase [Actinomadura verrucosospora]|uniref:Myo-inositol catabolism IolB domain-containing protein n=1 Tax=Actinomadura verrucosospora TaxID=46165 RepID=A0A7D3VPN1_ACTVE|nr:5-deoxy-glucuronate isomerase [Actinomadura verrucosospora]QKG19370.1 Myo-inositol catabolism IolB domain-containing protein [Actinomadura verrucosospora]
MTVDIAPADAGWTYSGLRVLTLGPGEEATVETGDAETLVLPLAGSCRATVTVPGEAAVTFDLHGRPDVFSRVTDFAYAPRDATVTVSSRDGGRFALPSARCERRLPPRYGPAEGVPVELRGAGSASRQVNNFCTPEAFEADRLIACEVLTPGGNWSSYPPHKHDEATATESVLEEIYYFEVADGPDGRPGMGYQRVYGTADRPVDVLEEVRTGDVVLIPHGWHGPSMAVPGYDLYYLNVMAGPGEERAWRICDDPAHAWVRGTWADEKHDPRLPMTSAAGRER